MEQRRPPIPLTLSSSPHLFLSSIRTKEVQHQIQRSRRSQGSLIRDKGKRAINTRYTGREHSCANASQETHRNCYGNLRPNVRRSGEGNGEDRHIQIGVGNRRLVSFFVEVYMFLKLQEFRLSSEFETLMLFATSFHFIKLIYLRRRTLHSQQYTVRLPETKFYARSYPSRSK